LATKGTLPKELITPSSQKYRSEIKKIEPKEKRKTRKQKQTFYLESNFGIDDLLQSGFVLYNDPLGKYVTQVADTLLVKKPELRAKLKFYVVRTSIVNAFATNQGYIFVTIRLLAQLENEAQPAFVLSHKIIHYEKQHALNFYLEASKIDKNSSQNSVIRAANFDRNWL
jgi:predicted Zn-dependent protease